ncbi:MAG: GGDEF domain-containing response regulator [Gallionella sp.]|nr:GGDEF domain-containing response regulator [Gallionella sp.]
MKAVKKVLRVLAVEDSEDDLELIRNDLTEGGFSVVHQRVETEESLRAALARASWDVVICDHNMPALDSISALRVVQNAVANVPFVIVSGLIPDQVAIEAMRRGAKDFICKDNLSRLLPVIERELGEAVLRTDLKAVQERLDRVTHFDTLTGLPNREHLFRQIGSMMSARDCPFAVFMIDLNRFRKITRSLGMQVGNRVLIELAGRLRAVFGEDDFVARYGADRFVAICLKIDQEAQAEAIAAVIHECLDRVFLTDSHELYVAASVGVSFYPRDGGGTEDLLENAETALYAAKAAGGRSFQAYKIAMNTTVKGRLAMESALYRALEKKEFLLHYQPQFDLNGTQMTGVEALVRWSRPESGMISPGAFIPILEETRLIVPVGEWILRTACAQNKQWQDAGLPPVRVAVNLSAIQFRQAGLVQTVIKVLQETGLSPEYLELEITENIAVHNEEAVIAILDELRAIGIQIAIDDFGTGYSSLSYLKRFPIDKLKIDQSFVRDYKEGTHDDGIVRAIIGMGHNLNLKVIAEGVETQEQADFLQRNGCDEVQGYFYGKPMAADDLAVLMKCAATVSRSR